MTNKISVEKYKWISESYGLVGYYDFEIKVTLNDKPPYTIYRRFSEIEYLNELLLITASGCLIPSLPEKSMMVNFSYHSEDFMKKRLEQINLYFNDLINHIHLGGNDHFFAFIKNETYIKRKELESKKSIFSSFKNMIGLPKGTVLKASDQISFYNKEDKENIQRLAKGVREIVNSYENYHQLNSNKKDSLIGIKDISKVINKTLCSKLDNNEDIENPQNADDKIISTNCDYLEKISEKIGTSNDALKLSLDELRKYLLKVESLEKIFLRLDQIRAGQFECKVDIDPKEINNKKFKEQLDDEIKLFRDNDERKIFDIIQRIFEIQINMNRSIREVFDEKSKEETKIKMKD